MHTIETVADLRWIEDTAGLPHDLIVEVDGWLWDVWRAVGGGDPEQFSLAATGPVVILEAEDPPEAVPGRCRKGAEWANVVVIGGVRYYDAGILEGNDRCWRVLGRVGALHPAVEAYLVKEGRCGVP